MRQQCVLGMFLLGITMVVSAIPCSAAGDQVLFINEIMASNRDTIADEDGEYEDWIELYNASHVDIDVTGYYLSDDPDSLNRWEIPTGPVSVHG